MRGRQTKNDSGAPERCNERNNYGGDAWCSRAQAKPKPRPPKPAKPNSNSAKWHKPFGQANRRSLGGKVRVSWMEEVEMRPGWGRTPGFCWQTEIERYVNAAERQCSREYSEFHVEGLGKRSWR
jgi:hypothetical protein